MIGDEMGSSELKVSHSGLTVRVDCDTFYCVGLPIGHPVVQLCRYAGMRVYG